MVLELSLCYVKNIAVVVWSWRVSSCVWLGPNFQPENPDPFPCAVCARQDAPERPGVSRPNAARAPISERTELSIKRTEPPLFPTLIWRIGAFCVLKLLSPPPLCISDKNNVHHGNGPWRRPRSRTLPHPRPIRWWQHGRWCYIGWITHFYIARPILL